MRALEFGECARKFRALELYPKRGGAARATIVARSSLLKMILSSTMSGQTEVVQLAA
jgi:hypothetical protein